MKTWIINNLNVANWKYKKITANVALITLLVNIIAPGLTYAALADFSSTLAQPNVLAVAQVNRITLPRVLVEGDLLELTISGTTVSQSFSGTSLDTANLFNVAIDALQEVTSVYDDSSKIFTITSAQAGVPVGIWDLRITRTSINPTTPTPNVVAIAQVWEVNIPQQLFAWDTIHFTVDGTGITESFSWSKDATLTSFADKITSLTSVSWSYDSGNNKVVMSAKTAWTSFSMSNLVINSDWIAITNLVSNVVPVSQIEEINFPRIIYSDETISVTINWSWISQSYNTSSAQTLSDLNNQINSLSGVNSTILWSTITITSSTPWVAFTISNTSIFNWTINWINVTPNQIAIAQEDIISIPRDLYIWDTIHFDVWWHSLTQWFTATSANTIAQLITQIDALPNVYVSAYAPWLRAITVKSTVAGTAFTSPSLYLSSSITSNNITASVAAQKQIWEYTINRTLVNWDNMSAIINWSPIDVDYSWSSANTINSFINEINNSMSWVVTASLTWTLWIHLEAATSWVWFTTQPLTINNTLTPTVIVANVTPVKQKETITLSNNIITWDVITLNLSWATVNTWITQSFDTDQSTTLTALRDKINLLSDFTASINGSDLIVEAKVAWNSINISNFLTTWQAFSWVTNTWNIAETKANLNLTMSWIPINWDNIQVGNCVIWFGTWSWDLNCNNGSAYINTSLLDNVSLASLLTSVSNIQDTTPDWTRNISATSSWNTVSFNTNGWEISTQIINYVNNLATPTDINLDSNNAWVLPQWQVDTITLPRNIVTWDSLQIIIDWITVTQNFLSSSSTSFNNLVTQINNLPNISATWAWNNITITADTPWTWFNVSSIQFTNSANPVTTVSNVQAVAQQTLINFPTSFVTWDIIDISIDWITVTWSFNTDSSTTLNNLISSITSSTSVNASLSWSLWMLLTAKNAWTAFVIDHIKVDNTINPVSIATNIAWVSQVDTITVPFVPASWDTLSVTVSWTTLNQSFVTNATTTLSLLNTQIDNLASVNSSFDGNSTFTITAATAWIPFTAWLSSLWATITSSWIQTNINSWAQVDTLTVNRNLATWDNLVLNIDWATLNQAFNTDKTTTLGALNTQINTLTWVSSVFDGNETFTLTATNSWIAFTGWVLSIYSTIPSVNTVANVPAVTQIDTITLARALIAWDALSLTISGNTIGPVVFSGSQDTTLTNFINTINNAQSWAIASYVWNVITLTASVSWIPFTASWFSIENTSLSNITTPNVTAVKQVSQFDIPLFVTWDNISFTLDWTGISQDFTVDNVTTINSLTGKISAIWTVDVDYLSNSWIIQLTSKVAWTPFTISQVSVINTTPAIQTVANVVPVAQVVSMYPSWTLREWLTFRVTVNSTDYDYLTNSWDTVSSIINNLIPVVTNTWVIVSSWSDIWWEFLSLTSSVPWLAFSYNSQVLDITPPIITNPINTAQTLKTWDVSVSNVSINEDGTIYLVLSGTTISNESDLINAVANNNAFIWKNNALSYIQYTITVPGSISDWLYNFIAVDDYHNVSQAIPGWLTVDNTAPVVNISTLPTTTNNSGIVISGTTEANTPVTINGWSWIINTTSDWAWAFSGTVELNQNTINNIIVSAQDIAWNIWTGSVAITHDNITPSPLSTIAPTYSNTWTVQISVNTESWILASIYNSGSLLNTWTTDSSWSITFDVNLVSDSVNNFDIIVTDAWGNTNSTTVVVIQDSTNPNIILNPLPNSVHTGSINISWTTEPLSSINIDNSWTTYTWTADSSWIFNISVSLNSQNWTQTLNTINIEATDQAWNIWTWVVSIIEDSEPNNLIISTPSQYINSSTITVTWSTKPNSAVSISWWLSTINITADWTWLFTWTVSLNLNNLNVLDITSTDSVNNIMTWSINITQDNTAPVVNISTPSHPTNSLTISLTGTTEADSIITVTWWSGTFNSVSDWSWNYNISVDLNSWVANNLSIDVTDQAWNIWTWTISITHDPIVVFINLSAPSLNYTNQSTFTLSWTTKPNTPVQISWWSWVINTTSDWIWAFSWIVELNLNITNNLVISATDTTTTTASTWITIINDNIAPTLSFNTTSSITNQSNLVVTWLTDNNSTVSINNSWVVTSWVASSTWIFSISVPMIQNTTNNIVWTATDLAWNVSTSTWFSILHDNIAPTITWLNVTTTVVWASMNVNYLFDTDENSNSTFYIGSSSNVLASLLMSWATSGTNHSRVLPWFTPNTTYYYFVQALDSAWNTTQTSISTINFIDNAWPVVTMKSIDNVTTTWATLDFSYTDAHFNSWTLASGSIDITDGINNQTITPNLSYSNSTNNWSVTLSNLTWGTLYTYTINLTDDFWNLSSNTWAFITTSDIILSWSSMNSTWSVSLSNWVWWTADMSGTTLTIISDPNMSWISSWSIIIPWSVDIIYWTWWNNILSAPVMLDANSSSGASNSELISLVSGLNTSTMTYSPSVVQTISAWWNVPLTASWWYFTVNISLNQSLVWQTLRLYRSQNGSSWIENVPDNQCIVNASNICSFRTDHFTLFAVAKAIWTPITVSNSLTSGWWGGGWISMDYCPTWDYSPSYYDGICWTKTSTNSSTISTSTNTWTNGTTNSTNSTNSTLNTKVNNNTDQLASKYILKIKSDNYPAITTLDQKIDLWQKTITKIDTEIKKPTISKAKQQLLELVKVKAKDISDSLVIERDSSDKWISGTKSEEKYIPSTEMTVNSNWNVSIYKFINVANSVVVRKNPSYKWEIVDYLPRNFKVELLASNNLWSKIRYNWGTSVAYIRNTFLRDENREDKGRRASLSVFFDTTLQADVDMRMIKVAHSVNVRRWPSMDDDIKTTIYNGEKVLVLDSTKVNWWYEIKWSKWHGWVASEYVSEIEK